MTATSSEATVSAGLLRGICVNGIRTFLGVPYAAPPVGANRFRSPQPVAGWDGVRDATVPGPSAPQRIRAVPGIDVIALVGDGGERGDDYLTLNVWSPEHAAGAPVIVWIHGGGFVVGNKDAPVQDGATFARDGVICVAINYRMGIDGFLPIPGVPTNLGLRDMLAALRWVQAEIAAFGGDPGNVTVFGESAGAMAIADLVTAPAATGLFTRVIIQSGHGAMVRDVSVAQRLVKKLATLLKITPDAAGFSGVGIEEGLDAIERVSAPTTRLDLRDADGREPVFGISRFIPVWGDDVLPAKPIDALRAGDGAGIDVLIGTNAEEMNLYFVPTGVRAKIGRLLAWLFVRRSMPRAWAALKAYGMGTKGVAPGEAMTRALSDLVFRWPARQYAAAHQGRTWMYEFDWRSPACGGELGAAHAMDVPFVFDALASARGPEGIAGTAPPQALATDMHALWVRFATDGTLPWTPFDEASRQVYQISRGVAVHEAVMPAADFLPR